MRNTIRLKEIADNDHAHYWYYPRAIDSDHPTYLVVKLEYTDRWNPPPEYSYHIEVIAVGPKWPSKESLEERLHNYEMTYEQFMEYELEGQLELLCEMGFAAYLWKDMGSNERKLLKAAREEIQLLDMIAFDFRMDGPQNAVGDTGWDWIQGKLCTFRDK